MSCGAGCMECSTKDTCTKCEDAADLLNGQCTCKAGYFMDAAFGTCKSCNPSCATCDSDIKCKTCPAGFELGATKCLKCAADEFISGDSCVKCGPNCEQCDSGPNKC